MFDNISINPFDANKKRIDILVVCDDCDVEGINYETQDYCHVCRGTGYKSSTHAYSQEESMIKNADDFLEIEEKEYKRLKTMEFKDRLKILEDKFANLLNEFPVGDLDDEGKQLHIKVEKLQQKLYEHVS